MTKVIDATELDGVITLIVDLGGRTTVVSVPAGSDRQTIKAACKTRVQEEEARERRKVRRNDLLGDL